MKKWIYLLLPLALAACQTLPTSSEWLVRGDGYLKDGQAEKAIAAYDKGLRLNDKNTSLYASRGSAYFFNGDYKAAHADFLKVLELNPYTADGYTALGSVLAAQGYYESAMEALNLALLLDPGKVETFFSRGGVNFMLEQYDQAVHDYSYVLKIRPSADVYNARGAAYLKLGEKEKAEQDFAMAKSGQVPEKLNDYRMID